MLTHSQTYPHIREHHSNFHAPSVMFKRGFSSFIGPVVMVVGSGDGTQSLPCARWAAYQWGTPLALLKMPSITLTDRHHYPCFTVHMEQNNQAALSATLWELTEKATTWRDSTNAPGLLTKPPCSVSCPFQVSGVEYLCTDLTLTQLLFCISPHARLRPASENSTRVYLKFFLNNNASV